MTRINCGISPSELSNKHLCAEHREIKEYQIVSPRGGLILLDSHPNLSWAQGTLNSFMTNAVILKEDMKRFILNAFQGV